MPVLNNYAQSQKERGYFPETLPEESCFKVKWILLHKKLVPFQPQIM